LRAGTRPARVGPFAPNASLVNHYEITINAETAEPAEKTLFYFCVSAHAANSAFTVLARAIC